MEKVYIGIDNGTTGSIGIIDNGKVHFQIVPSIKEQSYTKQKAIISRIDWPAIVRLLEQYRGRDCIVVMERPMVNPTRFKASMSALRAIESVLIAVELLELPHSYIDSKEWQKEILPKGTKGSPELKKASMDIGCRLFPTFAKEIKKQKDADGLLIAEYCRRVL